MDRYLEFFNLKEDPFRLTPDPAYYYPSQEHVNALLSLEYCMEHKEGFCILTGEPGTGKTTLLKIFMNVWQSRAEIALVMTPRLAPEEFLRAVLDDFSITVEKPGKNEMIKAFRDFLLLHSLAGRSVAIVVDEAQNLPYETLEELRLLSNLETDKDKLLQIILIGQPELARKLQTEGLQQLNQRITVRSALNPLSQPAVSDYLKARLVKAGNGGRIFDEKAVKKIYKLSGGIPRVINIVASRALMVGYMQGKSIIEKGQVDLGGKEISENLSHIEPYSRAQGRRLPVFNFSINRTAVTLIVLILLLMLAAGIWQDQLLSALQVGTIR